MAGKAWDIDNDGEPLVQVLTGVQVKVNDDGRFVIFRLDAEADKSDQLSSAMQLVFSPQRLDDLISTMRKARSMLKAGAKAARGQTRQ